MKFFKNYGSYIRVLCAPLPQVSDVKFMNNETGLRDFTGKSITMLCNFQAESSPVLSEAEVRKRSVTWHVRGPSRLYLLCDNCDVQYFCRVREEQLRLYLIFTSIKMHMYGKQSTLSH